MAPQRSASAPLPPFCSFLTKRGRVASAFVLRHVRTVCPAPPLPPLASLAAPPHSRWGLQFYKRSLRPYPNPHPRPLLASLAAPLPLPAGGFNYHANSLRPYPKPHPFPRPIRPAPSLSRRGL